MILQEDGVWLVVRPWMGSQQVWQLPTDPGGVLAMTLPNRHNLDDRQVERYQAHIFNIDLQPKY
jgi:sucrose synthase